MSLTPITYLPVNSGLGDTAPAAAAKINAAFVETDTALASANAALSASGTATTTANSAYTLASGQTASITTLNSEVATLTTTTNNLASSVAAIASQQVITASSYPGIDKTGVTSSLTAFNAMVALAVSNYAAGHPTTVIIDCPILLSVGSVGASTIFWPSNVNLKGTPEGMLMFDNLGIPLMFMCNVSNITWQDVHFRYVQPYSGAYLTNQSNPNGWVNVAGAFQSQYLGGTSGYLHTVNNVTYGSGATPIWSGASALTSFINMRGACTNITFDRCIFDVPPGANPGGFYYQLVSFTSEFIPNQVVIGVQNISTITWSSGVATVTMSSGNLNAFTTGSQYYFYISGSSIPQGYVGSFYCTKLSSNSFSYPLAVNPGTYSGTGYMGTPTTSTVTAAVPTGITVRNCTIDGACMSFVGPTQMNMIGNTFLRYSDLQDGTNGTITFASAPTNGATTATLATNWALPTGQYWAQLTSSVAPYLNGQIIGMNMTNGSTACSGFVDPFTGNSTSVVGQMIFTGSLANGATGGTLSGWTLGRGVFQVSFTSGDTRTVTVTTTSPYTTFTCTFTALTGAASATGTLILPTVANSGWVGGMPPQGSQGYYIGVLPYSPPPHAIYCGSNSGAFPAYINAHSTVDLGIRTFNTAYARTQNSGNTLSCKVELGRGTVIMDWTSYRADGGFDLQSMGGTQGSTVKGLTTYYNSANPLTDYNPTTGGIYLPGAGGRGNPNFGCRFPGPSSYNNITAQDITVIDSNPSPIQTGFIGTGFTPNQNISCTGLKIYLNDWTYNSLYTSSQYQPSVFMAGTNIEIDASIMFNSFSATQTGLGYVPGNNVFNQNSNIYLKYYGFRAVAITLASPLSAGGVTTGTIAAAGVVGGYSPGWPFPSGIYKVFFYDNSVRYCTFTLNSPTFNWTGQATVGDGVSTTGITAQNLYYQNYSYTPKVTLPTVQGYSNNRLRIDDYTNQMFYDCTSNMAVQEFRDDEVCLMSSVAGTNTYTTHIQLFSSFSLVSIGVFTVTTLGGSNGATGYTVGYSGSNAAILTNNSLNAHTNSTNFNPVTLSSIASAATGTTRTLTITATGGTFDANGAIVIAVRQQQQFMAY